MEDLILDDLLDMVDDLRDSFGNTVDYDHVDETTKTFYVCRTSDFDLTELDEMREYLKEDAPMYRVGSILRHTL